MLVIFALGQDVEQLKGRFTFASSEPVIGRSMLSVPAGDRKAEPAERVREKRAEFGCSV